MAAELRALEELLLTSETRTSRDDLDRLLADDFVEFGSSGGVYTKAEVISAVPLTEPCVDCTISEFRALALAPDAVLVTYRLPGSLRSSVWRRDVGGWRMVFHQGTRTR